MVVNKKVSKYVVDLYAGGTETRGELRGMSCISHRGQSAQAGHYVYFQAAGCGETNPVRQKPKGSRV